MIVVSGILTDMVPAWPVTEDILLIAIFGGLINALAISLCLFANATSGGTDFIAIFFFFYLFPAFRNLKDWWV